jgi:hypothetical protein
MAKVMREPGDGYWSERAALEHKAAVFQISLVSMIIVFALSQVMWWQMYMRVADPVIVHASAGTLSMEPTAYELQFQAWEVLRPFLTADSSSVVTDVQDAKRFMTESCAMTWDRALADYEREFKKSWVQSVAELGVQTQWGEPKGERLENTTVGGVTKYVVRIAGERTILSKTKGTGEPQSFDYIVVLERAPRSKTNPSGLLVSEIRPAPVKGSDGVERDGRALVPFAAAQASDSDGSRPRNDDAPKAAK